MSAFRSLHGPVVLVLGPHLGAISGVSAHLKSLLHSQLHDEFVLDHFQVGSEGRAEGALRRLLRLACSPFALATLIRRRKPDIVHLNSSLNARAFWRDMAYALVARLCRARVVLQVHGGKLPQVFFGRGTGAQALLRALLRLPDALVVLARTELAAYRSFLPGGRIVLVANGIDHMAFATPRPVVPPRTPLRLVYLGRLAREKGVNELLHGLAVALQHGANARLVIAGSGAEEAALRATAARLRLGDAVSFNGATYDADKIALLRQSDVFVLTSCSEGLPIALLEGMAAGNAVIATPVGAIPDVVLPGEHGLLVPVGDAAAVGAAILRLATDRTALTRMQRAGAARIAAGYSLARVAQDFSDLYWLLSADRPRAGAAVKRISTCAE